MKCVIPSCRVPSLPNIVSSKQRNVFLIKAVPTPSSSQPDPALTNTLKKTLQKLESGLISEEIEVAETQKTVVKPRIGSILNARDDQLPRVALVGRPNVGKSALLNRLSKSSKAIVFDQPGITRDRLLVRAFWQRSEFMLIDTGGLPDTAVVSSARGSYPTEKTQEIPFGVETQVAAAVEEADCIVIVVDGQEGPTSGDEDILTWLKRQHGQKPVLMAVNKCDNGATADLDASAFWELGLQPFPISAISGSGTGDFLDELVSVLPPTHYAPSEQQEELTSVVIMGRPNTGKSSLLNILVGRPRSIVSQVAGTTRDAVDCEARLAGGEIVKLVDTAGIRRRTAVYGSKEKVEPMMVNHSIRALNQSNIAILMTDCMEGVTLQDSKILELAEKEGSGLVIVASKFDLLDPEDWDKQTVRAVIKQQLREARWAKVVVTSLTQEKPIKAISKAILEADQNHSKRITTSTVNQIVQDAVHFKQPPTSRNGKRGRVYYASQPSTRPPTFVLFVNDEGLFDEPYRKYLEKHFRQNIDLDGTSIKIFFRGKPDRDFR